MLNKRVSAKSGFKLKNVTFILLGLNIAMYMFQSIFGDVFTSSLMLVSGDIFTRPWIMLSSMFLHGGSWHLLFNMYALFIFGPLIERRIGSKRFLGAYLFSGILASLIYGSFNTFIMNAPNAAAVGASGAIMALLGLTIILLPHLIFLFFFVIPMSMRTAGIVFALMDLIGFITPSNTGIAHLAHLVGLGCGLLFGWYLLKKKKVFVQQFTRTGPRVKVFMGKMKKTPPPNNKQQSSLHDDTIELSKDDVDNYFKYGRL